MAIIQTTLGEMDESLLEKRTGVDEDDRARAEWVEYWKDDTLVHRSVHLAIKQGFETTLELGDFA